MEVLLNESLIIIRSFLQSLEICCLISMQKIIHLKNPPHRLRVGGD